MKYTASIGTVACGLQGIICCVSFAYSGDSGMLTAAAVWMILGKLMERDL